MDSLSNPNNEPDVSFTLKIAYELDEAGTVSKLKDEKILFYVFKEQ